MRIILPILCFVLSWSIPCVGVDYCRLLAKEEKAYFKILKKEKGLSVMGTGGSMMRKIESVSHYFESYQELDIDQARLLYIEVVEGFVKRMNENEKIRPFLRDYPFTYLNTSVTISFSAGKGNWIDEPYVALICMTPKGQIFYHSNDAQTDTFIDLHNESYTEALSKTHEHND